MNTHTASPYLLADDQVEHYLAIVRANCHAQPKNLYSSLQHLLAHYVYGLGYTISGAGGLISRQTGFVRASSNWGNLANRLGIRPGRPPQALPQLSRPAPAPALPAPTTLGLTLLQLESHACHWPQAGAEGYLFCGHPTHGESAYCAYHHRISYRPAGSGQPFVPQPRRGKTAARAYS